MDAVQTVLRAAEFAAAKHAGQRRKGVNAEPYLNHLIEVARLVADAAPGDPDLVAAALLHDVVEDQDVTNAEVAERFGERVASIVAEVTDDKSLPNEERKRRQIASAPGKSQAASLLKLADKTSNLRALAQSPPPWDAQRKIAYVAWARSVVSALPHKPADLSAQFEAAANSALDSLRDGAELR